MNGDFDTPRKSSIFTSESKCLGFLLQCEEHYEANYASKN